MRLAGERPPSTRGETESMTARTRPSPAGEALPLGSALPPASTMRLPPKHDGGQGRKRQIQRFDAARRGHGNRLHRAEIPPACAAVFARIAVQDLAPDAPLR